MLVIVSIHRLDIFINHPLVYFNVLEKAALRQLFVFTMF